VHSDSYRALVKIIESTPGVDLDRACARAAHFGNFTINALRHIIDLRLFERPPDDLSIIVPSESRDLVGVRRLEAYSEIVGGWPC
jgi:hypothetical protein